MMKAKLAVPSPKQPGLPKAIVKIAPAGNPDGAGTSAIRLLVRIENLPPVTAGDTADVWLGITEDKLQTNVTRGENAGRILNHTAVVRKLRVIGSIDSGKATTFSFQPTLTISSGWKRENLRAVVFVQERASRRVLGARAVGLTAEPNDSASR